MHHKDIYLKNIIVHKSDISLMGKDSKTLKFIYNDEISFLKFRLDEDDVVLKWLNDWEDMSDNIILNVIGKCGINSFKGILSPQIIVETWERILDDQPSCS